MKQNSIATPRQNISGTVISRPGSSPIPTCTDSSKLRYAPRMTMMPCAMLMMSITPKIRVRPAAISAYTPPVRMPSITASRKAVPDTRLLPGWLRVGWRGRPGSLRGDYLIESAVLPLERQRLLSEILTELVEFDGALDAGECDSTLQVF